MGGLGEEAAGGFGGWEGKLKIMILASCVFV